MQDRRKDCLHAIEGWVNEPGLLGGLGMGLPVDHRRPEEVEHRKDFV